MWKTLISQADFTISLDTHIYFGGKKYSKNNIDALIGIIKSCPLSNTNL